MVCVDGWMDGYSILTVCLLTERFDEYETVVNLHSPIEQMLTDDFYKYLKNFWQCTLILHIIYSISSVTCIFYLKKWQIIQQKPLSSVTCIFI